MNMKLTALSTATLFALSSGSVFANDDDNGAGFSAELGLGVGIFSSKDNLSTDGDAKILNYGSASSETEFTFEPIIRLEYAFNEQHYIYGGTNNEEIIPSELALELGYGYNLANGTVVDISFISAIMAEEVWQNPYTLNGDREVTDLSSNGFRFQAEDIAGSNLSFDGLYYTTDVDKEAITDKALERSGSGFDTTLAYTHFLDDVSAITPSVNYGSFSADGDAESFSEYGLGIEYMRQAGKHAFILGANYGVRNYDASNPVFSKTRDNSQYGVEAMYQMEEFMDWENVAFIALAGYEVSDSNIDFYDSSEYQVMTGLTYAF